MSAFELCLPKMSVRVNKTGADDCVAAINNFGDIFGLWYVVGNGEDEIISNQNVKTFGDNMVVLLVQNNGTGF
jgi:hypothetical protein